MSMTEHAQHTAEGRRVITEPGDGFEWVACVCCGSRQVEPAVAAPDRYMRGDPTVWFQVVKCLGCGLHFQNPRPIGERLAALYPEHYYSYKPEGVKPVRGLNAFGRRLEYGSKLALRRAFWGYPCPAGAAGRWLLRFLLWPLWVRLRWLGRDMKFIEYRGRGRFLDVGCGAGRQLAYHRQFGLDVAGVELSAAAAREARDRYGLDVRAGTLEQAKFSNDAFDIIHMSHVFEHLPNPADTLDEMCRILDAGGLAILKVPNMASVSAERFGTYWLGLDLPRHLYHFSPGTITRLLEGHGFVVEKIRQDLGAWGVWRESTRFKIREQRDEELGESRWRDAGWRLAELLTCWRRRGSVMAVYARKAAPGSRLEARGKDSDRTSSLEPRARIMDTRQPVCDLILLSWNQLDETKACLGTLFDSVHVAARLLIVDNGSEPPVRAFLKTVGPQGAVREVQLLQNDTNEGFPRGMNRGIQASTAPYVCLLNNDLRFTEGWLEELIRVAEADPANGVVNPLSNTLGHHPPRGLSLEAYARQRQPLRGRFVELGKCGGFCLLIRRDVLARIDGLSEEVERCFFEDEDFAMRAQQAGYRCVAALGAYVHHAEHRSVRLVPDREALFARNRQWCEARWGRWLRVAWPRFAPLTPGAPDTREWLERVTAWARRRSFVHVYCPMPSGTTKDALFRSVGLVPHAGVRWRSVPRGVARWGAAGCVLMRRKKGFDIIVAPDPRWQRLLERLRWLHGADVVPETDEDQLAVAWTARSRPTSKGSAKPSAART